MKVGEITERTGKENNPVHGASVSTSFGASFYLFVGYVDAGISPLMVEEVKVTGCHFYNKSIFCRFFSSRSTTPRRTAPGLTNLKSTLESSVSVYS